MSLTKVSFSMINGSVFNVVDYGAVGNGVTADSTAINAAIADAHTQGGGVVFLPVGTYKLDAQILLKPGVSLIGEQKGEWGAGDTPGVAFSKEFTTGSVFYSPNTQTIAGVSYENFYIKGNKGGVGGSNGNGFEILLGHDIIFRRVWTHECPSNGFSVGQGSASYHNYFYNCYASFNGGSGYVVQSDWMRFIDCWADGNYIGIEFPNNAYCGAFANIDRCHFEEFELAAIAIRGNPSLGSNGNHIIRDNKIWSRPYQNTWPAHGIYIETASAASGASGSQITGNFITYQTTYGPTKTGKIGINLVTGGAVLNLTVSDNSIGGFGTGVLIPGSCARNIISQNSISGCDLGMNNAGGNNLLLGNTFTSNVADLTDTGGYARVIGNYFSVAPSLAGTDFVAANQP